MNSTSNPDRKALLATGKDLMRAGELGEAEQVFRRILENEPGEPDALHLLGLARFQIGHYEEAVKFIKQAIAHAQPNEDYLHNLGAIYKKMEKWAEATENFRQALEIKPDYIEAHINLGSTLKELGLIEEAVGSYRNALAIKPDFAEVHNNLGNLLKHLGRRDEAIASYQKALAIEPGFAEAHNNLGNLYGDLGNLDEAVASYHKALAIKSDFAKAYNNLGSVLKEKGNLDEAVASYRKALDIEPDSAELHYNLGNTLKNLGKLDEAVASYRKALDIKPEYAGAHSNLGGALLGLGKLDEAVAKYREAVAIMPDFYQAQSNLIFSLNYNAELLPADLFVETSRFGAMVAARAMPVVEHSNNPDPDRRLRIGLMSGDFRRHSVGFFLENILSEIEKEQLEIFAYATSGIEDDLTARIKKNVSQWRNVMRMDDGTLAEKIIEDGIDILVDLSGHTAHNRLSLFSMKPAPIQVTWLGFSATTGVDAIDYILCDKWVIPPGDEGQFVEKPWRLPDVYLCFSPPDLKVDIGPPPVRANSYITFGCFNNLSKVTDTVMSCWAEILRAVPDSRLLLKAKQLNEASVQEDVLSRFARYGVSSELLILKGYSKDRAEHLTNYDLIDIALDPFPYAGTTTSIEALWMGTPLLTLQGDRFISRVGVSILRNVGLGEWIGVSPQDYIEKGIAFASDLPALSASREGLRERLLASSVCDAPRYARHLEDAFQGMWRNWCVQPKIIP